MRKVSIIGADEIRWGVLKERTFPDMIAEAGNKAIRDSGIDRRSIQALYMGNYSGPAFVNQATAGSLAATVLGMPNVPAFRVEAACSSGAIAFREAYIAVAAGVYDFALVLGAEKLNTKETPETMELIAQGADLEERAMGLNAPAMFALYAQAHMKRYGTTKEQLAHVSAKSYYHGSLNPHAHVQKAISVEEVMNAPIIATPLGRHDCSLVTDGAAAIVICPSEIARLHHPKPIQVAASALAGETFKVSQRESLTSMGCTKRAAAQAFAQAGLTPKDISFVECHDCFSITEIINIEDLGFFRPGEAGPATVEGKTRLGGPIPVNVSGGLKSKGHAIGATGVGQIVEITYQLRGVAGPRQVKNAETALTHMLGGPPSVATIHIFQRGY
jgi:acetyl-CoA C-acetyltransferase